MRYGSVWQDSARYIRFAAFAVLLLIAILLGHGLRSLRHHGTASASTVKDLMSSIERDADQHLGGYETHDLPWLTSADDNTPLHVKGYQFTLASVAQPSLVISPRTSLMKQGGNLAEVTDRVDNALIGAGFTKSADPEITVIQNATKTAYTRGQIHCATTTYPTVSTLVLQCNDPTSLEQRAKEVQPFVDSYLAAHIDVRPQDIVFGQLTIKSRDGGTTIKRSVAQGFDLAEAVIYRPGAAKGTLVLFYQHNGQWQYVTESDMDEQKFSCSVIESDPLASKAFIGNPCWDDNLKQVRRSGVVTEST